MFDSFGKMLIVIGVFLVIAGIVFTLWSRIPLPGRLPGDFFFQKGNVTFIFPLATSLVLSLVLTVILNIVFRLFK
jgi:tellurite resistance protein TehA-like permease